MRNTNKVRFNAALNIAGVVMMYGAVVVFFAAAISGAKWPRQLLGVVDFVFDRTKTQADVVAYVNAGDLSFWENK